MTWKMLGDLNQLLCDDMEDPISELAGEVEQSDKSFLEKLAKSVPADELLDMDNELLSLTSLHYMRGFAYGLAAARRLAKEWP